MFIKRLDIIVVQQTWKFMESLCFFLINKSCRFTKDDGKMISFTGSSINQSLFSTLIAITNALEFLRKIISLIVLRKLAKISSKTLNKWDL